MTRGMVADRVLEELTHPLPHVRWCMPVDGNPIFPPHDSVCSRLVSACETGLNGLHDMLGRSSLPPRAYNTLEYVEHGSLPPRADNTLDDVPGEPVDHVAEYLTRSHALYLALKNHLLRKIKGYILSKILLAQDALKVLCPKVLWSDLTKRQRDLYYNINEALRPWVYRWIGMDANRKSKLFHAAWKGNYIQGPINDGDHVVYARVNVHDHRTYIGKTSHYMKRFKQHTQKLLKHTLGMGGRDREHRKYSLHLGIPYTQWITIPISSAQTSKEALNLERWWIKRTKPSINASAKPFWLLRHKENMAMNTCRANSRCRHKKLTQPHMSPTAALEVSHTKYLVGSSTYLDAKPLIKIATQTGRPVTIKVIPGSHDLTNWRAVKEQFGYIFMRC